MTIYTVIVHSQLGADYIKIKSTHSTYDKAVTAMRVLIVTNKVVGVQYDVLELTA